MYKLIKIGLQANVQVREYVVDSASDIANLPADDPFGSTAYVVGSGDMYIKNSNGEYVVISQMSPVYQDKTVTVNGVVTPDDGYDALSRVVVNVPTAPMPEFQTKTVTQNGTVYPDEGYDALVSVVVDVQEWLDRSFHDDADHYWIELLDPEYLDPKLVLGIHGTIVIDWGDGTTPETIKKSDGSINAAEYQHEYAEQGRYIVTIKPVGDTTYNTVYRTASTVATFVRETYMLADSVLNYYYKACLRKIEINKSLFTVTNDSYALNAGAFSNAGIYYAEITSENSIQKEAFSSCTNLRAAKINSAYSIGASAFSGCGHLSHINIPKTVASIAGSAFANCYSMLEYDFTDYELVEGVLPVTFGTNVFSGIRTGTKIIFKDAETAAVAKETTNLATYAAYITYPGEVMSDG